MEGAKYVGEPSLLGIYCPERRELGRLFLRPMKVHKELGNMKGRRKGVVEDLLEHEWESLLSD
jgi:hypothetical protein